MNLIAFQALLFREVQRFMRVYVQALISPWISALLYIVVFGSIVGSRIAHIQGISYIDFVLPGIVMMNIIQASHLQGAFGLYMHRFTKSIEEILVAPISYAEVVIAFVAAAIFRGLLVGLGVYVLALFFTVATIAHIGLFLFYSIAIATIFGLIGLLVGLWSKDFEQLSVLNTFIILPLTFLGGVFNSITMLPERMQIIMRLNPFFYFVDGLRYAMIGVAEANQIVGIVMILVFILVLSAITWRLFAIGWRLRV